MCHRFYPSGLGIPTPERPDQKYHRRRRPDPPPSSLFREGNSAVPVQDMYRDAPDPADEIEDTKGVNL